MSQAQTNVHAASVPQIIITLNCVTPLTLQIIPSFNPEQSAILQLNHSLDHLLWLSEGLRETLTGVSGATSAYDEWKEDEILNANRLVTKAGFDLLHYLFDNRDNERIAFLSILHAYPKSPIFVTNQLSSILWDILYTADDDPLESNNCHNCLGYERLVYRRISKNPDTIQPDCSIPNAVMGFVNCNTLPSGSTMKERDAISKISNKLKVLTMDPLTSTKISNLQQFYEFCREYHDVVHFNCHLNFDSDAVTSWFRVSDAHDIAFADVNSKSMPQLTGELVMLSMCDSATASPLSAYSFASIFGEKKHAKSVVATQCRVDDAFGTEFSELVYKELMTGLSVGNAFQNARVHFIQRRNPSSLFYCLFGDPHFRLLGESNI